MYGSGSVKQALVELYRGGCRVETVAHDPPTIRFRTRSGEPCALFVDRDEVVLARDAVSTRHPSLSAALRAAARS